MQHDLIYIFGGLIAWTIALISGLHLLFALMPPVNRPMAYTPGLFAISVAYLIVFWFN